MTIDERKQTRQALAALVDAYRDTRDATPRDTLDALAARMTEPGQAPGGLEGMAAALWTVATAINGVGSWDGRVRSSVREWAAAFPYCTAPEALEAAGCYAPSDIHPAHLDQIGREAVRESGALDLDRR